MVEESEGASSSNADSSDDESDWEIYERDYSPKHFKEPNVGPDFQITDALPCGQPRKLDVDLSAEVWNPDRISADNLGKNQH